MTPPPEVTESALLIACAGEHMLAIHHRPAPRVHLGLLVIVGGPQYRVGSHRQFTLLARACAGAGIPVLRFDCRGMGDSTGAARGFDAIDADIRAAVDAFMAREPALSGVVLWGLCDAAAAAVMYAPSDPRVRGLVLLNPWVHTEAGEAQARLRHYYWERITKREFWRRVLRLELDWRDSVSSLVGYLRRARGTSRAGDAGGTRPDFLTRMRDALAVLRRPVGIVLSGRDLVAAEYRALAAGAWREVVTSAGTVVHEIPEANHTFSSRAWGEEVEARTIEWVREWSAAGADAYRG